MTGGLGSNIRTLVALSCPPVDMGGAACKGLSQDAREPLLPRPHSPVAQCLSEATESWGCGSSLQGFWDPWEWEGKRESECSHPYSVPQHRLNDKTSAD
jgi:hypothetical protein